MKKNLSNFADSLISRDQMKSVKGGCGNGSGYCVCSTWPGSGEYNCGGGVFSSSQAFLMSNEFNNTLNDGYIYVVGQNC